MIWQEIERYLAAEGYSSDALQSLQDFIDAFSPSIELRLVLDGFNQTAKFIKQLIPNYPTNSASLFINEWQEICRVILSNQAFDTLLSSTAKPGKMPLRKYYGKAPVYVALWTRPAMEELKPAYFNLLAHLLLTVRILRDRQSKQVNHGLSEEHSNNYTSVIERALLDARNLTYGANLHLLEELPQLHDAPKHLFGQLGRFQELNNIQTLLKYLLDLRQPPHRHKNNDQPLADLKPRVNPSIDLPAETVVVATNHEPDQTDAIQVTVMQLPAVEYTRTRELEKSGCSPDEERSCVEIITQRVRTASCKVARSCRQKANNKRKIKTQLAMLNQRLTNRWEILSLHEVSSFLTAIANIVNNKGQSKYLPEETSPIEFAAVLTSMFWCSQRLEDLTKFCLYTKRPEEQDKEPGFVSMAGKPPFWLIKPATPTRICLPDELQRSQAYPTATFITLNSGIGIESIISHYVTQTSHDHAIRLFPRRLETYQKAMRQFITTVNSRHGTRLTENRITDHLFNVIERQPGSDLTTAMFITGREQFLGRNPSYYTSSMVSTLQAIYQSACSLVRDRHFAEQPREGQSRIDIRCTPMNVDMQTTRIGSPFCPTRQTVQGLSIFLKNSLQKASMPRDELKLLRLHNSMTRYTAFMIAFGTGFRAIRDPFLSAAEIDWKTGFAVVSDKDNEDGYNARLIWIPPVCLQQLQLFKEHQNNLLCRLSILVPNLQSLLAGRNKRSSGRSMFYSMPGKQSDEYTVEVLRPKRLLHNLSKIFALPVNANRHYLRSTLLERGCPIEVINAYMGHYERGEEPWGIFSGLSPLTYRDVLEQFLVPLLAEDGWSPMQGLGAKL